MASLLIRNVDPVLHARLKESAATNRRSLEEEAREALRAGLARQPGPPAESIADIALRLFGTDNGFDLDLPPRSPARPAPSFGPGADPGEP
jgi:plasmid stability protein